VLDELRAAVASASALVEEIGRRFRDGDAAGECLTRLEAELSAVTRRAAEAAPVPRDVSEQIAALLTRVREVILTGEEWLARAGPELAARHTRDRLRRAYGFARPTITDQ
jgi:hypothetical protein